MKILLTNDDGYNTPGILSLYKTLGDCHEVILVAPDREKSAVSHAISLNKPLRIDRVDLKCGGKGYAVSGTPADCVKLGLFEFFSSPPDLVLSGINPGSNTGININYSGTVAAAREAALNGIPGMAVSIYNRGKVLDFNGMARYTARLVDKICDAPLPKGTFLNINAPDIPVNTVRGVKITRQDSRNLSKQFEKRSDPKNKSYYWYSSIGQRSDVQQQDGIDTDVSVLSRNYISITPIQCDITNYKTITDLASFPAAICTGD